MYIIIMITEMVVMYTLGYYFGSSMWIYGIMIFGFQMLIKYGNERIYLEVIEDYPVHDCIKELKFKFLFIKLVKLSNKGIPREMYFYVKAYYISLWLYSVTIIICYFLDEDMANFIGIVYLIIIYIIGMICDFVMLRKSFRSRFKLLNIYNIKYLFLPGDEPYPRKIGTCYVINAYKKRRKRFATIQILETGEIKKKVLMEGKLHESEKWVYSVFEICKVYYIV